MRLLLEFSPCCSGSFDKLNKHAIQGLIYYYLKGTEFEAIHDSKKFKFFTFSDIFPIGDFEPGKKKNLLISSPNKDLISVLYDNFENKRSIRIKNMEFTITNLKKFNLKIGNRFITGSPIVLYKDNRSNQYFSFQRDKDLNFFLTRLKENALKKYAAFTGEILEFDENLFDELVFGKEVCVNDFKDGKPFIIIGTIWKLLMKSYIPEKYKKFYEFLLDCGLGEKNSLGFGFLNLIK